MIDLKKVKIPGVNVPSYWVDWIYNNSGIIVENIPLQSLRENPPSIFVTEEMEIWENIESVFETMNKCNIKSIVVLTMHVYRWTEEMLKRLNELSKNKNVTLISMSQQIVGYENFNCYPIDFTEHGISNDFNFLFTCELKEKRNPTKDFGFFVNMKRPDRIQIYNGLKNTDIFDNSIVLANQKTDMDRLFGWQQQLYQALDQVTLNDNIFNALKCWNGVLPNFKAYEDIFCEIVIESMITGPRADISEKTYRPIALNVPFVFLGHPLMYQKLLKDGYMIIDDGNFYKNWHKDISIEERIPSLITFLQKIKKDQIFRKEMEIMAQHNYENFWTKRKLSYIYNNYTTLKKCFDENLVQKIYKNLNS